MSQVGAGHVQSSKEESFLRPCTDPSGNSCREGSLPSGFVTKDHELYARRTLSNGRGSEPQMPH